MARYEERDATQTEILEHDNDKQAKRVLSFTSLVSEDHDEINLSYVSSGNGIGEIEFVTYKKNTNTVAILELSYNSDNKLISVTRI